MGEVLGTESSSRKTVFAGVVDDDVDRDPETQGSINERREYRAELAEGYRRAKEEAEDSGWHDVLEPTEHPSRTEPVPLWEVIDTRASHTRRFDDDPFDLDIPDEPSESRAVQGQLFF